MRLVKRKRQYPLLDIEALESSLLHTNGHLRCVIVDEKSATFGYRDIVSNLVPDTSIPIIDGGESVHLLNLCDSKLTPINYMPEDNVDKTPQDCFEATCWDELSGILGVGLPTSEKIKLGVFIALAFGEIILIFIFATMAMG